MLKKFEVKNFRGFEDWVTFDFEARDYGFNTYLVKDNIVNKAIVYGKNGVGKSCIGFALFDIVTHLTDKEIAGLQNRGVYRNLNHVDDNVCFKYTFQFDADEVVYEYQKRDLLDLVSEKLIINGTIYLDYDYFNDDSKYVSDKLRGDLNINLVDNKLSILKYICRNRIATDIPILVKLVSFCDGMLWYRSLSEGNAYTGFTNGGYLLTERLYETGRVKEFEKLLKDMDLDYTLDFESVNGNHVLFAYFDEGKNKVPFVDIASTGTGTLLLFFVWSITAFDKISFLFIDEFDAFLHFEASESLVNIINRNRRFQSILTTHNTNLMNNKITRPDCCYVMTHNKIATLYNCTERELREGHNLEKLYKSGEFDVR